MSGAPETAKAILAGEYVLGLLDDERAALVAQQARTDSALAAEIAFWRARLAPLDDVTPAAPPSALLWERIHAAAAPSAPPKSAARAGNFWRVLALGSMAAAAALALLVWRDRPAAPPPPWARAVAVLTIPGTPALALRAQVTNAGTITLVPLRPLPVVAGYHLGFWAWPRDHAQPVLLGTLPQAGGTLRYPLQALDGTPVMVTEEPDKPRVPAPGRTLYLGVLAATR